MSEQRFSDAYIPESNFPKSWPAPAEDVSAAREFVKRCAESPKPILLVPDKDADGLCSGMILSLTLQLLGKKREDILVHFIGKGRNVFNPEEKEAMTKKCDSAGIDSVVVLDQGSGKSEPLVGSDGPKERKVLIIDHHWSTVFPRGAQVLSACNSPPVAPAALLTYILCSPLHALVPHTTVWLAATGTAGDLSTTKFEPPFPQELNDAVKKYTTVHINSLVSLLNAPRRTPEVNVHDAWSLLQHVRIPASKDEPLEVTPKKLVKGDIDPVTLEILKSASSRVRPEVVRCIHIAPQFSTDKRMAVIEIDSPFQVHPVVSVIWAEHLEPGPGNELVAVCTANKGYIPGKVNFSCRVTRKRRLDQESGRPAADTAQDVDIIALLKEYAEKEPGLMEFMGDDFARGHKQASGGNVSVEAWNRFCDKGLELVRRGKGGAKSGLDGAEKK